MPAKTNSQHPDHVTTQSAKVAAEIEPILLNLQTYAIRASRNELRGDELTPAEALDALADYTVAYQRNDWYDGYLQGYAAAQAGKPLTDQAAYDALPEFHKARKQ